MFLKRGSIKIIDLKNAQFPEVYATKAKIQPIVDSNHPICLLVSFIMHEKLCIVTVYRFFWSMFDCLFTWSGGGEQKNQNLATYIFWVKISKMLKIELKSYFCTGIDFGICIGCLSQLGIE